ncbi:MAG: MliC family protein [Alphaproteobacteria bacterium]
MRILLPLLIFLFSAPSHTIARDAVTHYVCGSYKVHMRYDQDKGVIYYQGRPITIEQGASASGVRYIPVETQVNLPDLVFWNKGEEATLYIEEQDGIPCLVQP